MPKKDASIEVLIGLLDFHSDRATAHASFVVASIFGIFTLLFSFSYFNGQLFGEIVFVLAFVFLNALSFYSYMNFALYASVADNVRETLETMFFKDEKIKSEYKSLMDLRKNRSRIFAQYTNLKSKKWWKRAKFALLFTIWYFSIVVPFIWIFFKSEIIVEIALITSLITVPLVCLLVTKNAKFCQKCRKTNEANAKFCYNCGKPLD